jgi:hypothetical protein
LDGAHARVPAIEAFKDNPYRVNRRSVPDVPNGTAPIVSYVIVVEVRRTLGVGGASINLAVL